MNKLTLFSLSLLMVSALKTMENEEKANGKLTKFILGSLKEADAKDWSWDLLENYPNNLEGVPYPQSRKMFFERIENDEDNDDVLYIVKNYNAPNLYLSTLTTILRPNDAVEEESSHSLSLFETLITMQGSRSIEEFEKDFGAHIKESTLIIEDDNTKGQLTMSHDGNLDTLYQIPKFENKKPYREYRCKTSNISFKKLKKEIIG
jgi:hypothetical protein